MPPLMQDSLELLEVFASLIAGEDETKQVQTVRDTPSCQCNGSGAIAFIPRSRERIR